MEWLEVGDRVFTLRFEFFDQQIGVVLGGRDVLLVDTRSTPGQAREIVSELRALTREPVSIVVDTHWHFDHSFGNSVFRPAPIWGHVRTVDRLAARGAATIERIAEAIPAIADDIRTVEIDPPDMTLEDRATIEVGDRAVELTYLGRGHTDTDVVLVVPDAAVLFAGDLLEGQAPPSFGDSYPLEWPAAVEKLLPLATGAVVPGHGNVADRGFVEEQLEGFRGIVDLARRVHANELDLEAAIVAAPFGGGEPLRTAFERALAQLRDELS